MAIMMYVFDMNGKELDRGVFGGNGPAPLVNGQRDVSKREHFDFLHDTKVRTASDYNLDRVKVKIWGPGEGPHDRYVEWFTVDAA